MLTTGAFVALVAVAAACMVHEYRAMRGRHRRVRDALDAWSQLDVTLSRCFFDAMRSKLDGDEVCAKLHLDAYEALEPEVRAAWTNYRRLAEAQ